MQRWRLFYAKFYARSFEQQTPTTAKPATEDPPEEKSRLDVTKLAPADYSARLHALLDSALKVAEQFFNLPSKGTFVDRSRRIEEASWQVIYREDLPKLSTLSSLERGLADWAAQEASLREMHMRVVESFVAVDGDYLQEKPSFERCAEMAMLMFDLVTKLGDRPQSGRPRLGKRWVKMTVQPPICVSDRLADYQQNRRTGRTAVATLTEEIRLSLENTIER